MICIRTFIELQSPFSRWSPVGETEALRDAGASVAPVRGLWESIPHRYHGLAPVATINAPYGGRRSRATYFGCAKVKDPGPAPPNEH